MGIRADQTAQNRKVFISVLTLVSTKYFSLFFLNMEYCAFVWPYSHYLTGLSCAMSKTLQMIQQLSAMDASMHHPDPDIALHSASAGVDVSN